MTAVVFIAFCMLAALSAAIVAAVSGLAKVHSPDTPRAPRKGLRASVECPRTGDITGILIGCEPDSSSLVVRRCDRFGEGPVTCDRACLPALA